MGSTVSVESRKAMLGMLIARSEGLCGARTPIEVCEPRSGLTVRTIPPVDAHSYTAATVIA